MTLTCRFFSDGTNYNQTDFAKLMKDSVGDGFVPGVGGELEVTPTNPVTLGVEVKTGRGYVQGFSFDVEDSAHALTLQTADGTHPRIDRVVARLSVSSNRNITLAVLTGTPAAAPSAPNLTRGADIYEVALAQISVAANVTSVSAANITDERFDVGHMYEPIGKLMMFAGADTPARWLSCDGSAVSRTKYARLFAVIGTTYGIGDGSSTFNLPNFGGRMPRGGAPGATGGADTIALTTAQMPAHNHTIEKAGAHAHSLQISPPEPSSSGSGYGYGGKGVTGAWTSTNGEHTHTIGSEGSGEAVTITNPYLTVMFLIYAGA